MENSDEKILKKFVFNQILIDINNDEYEINYDHAKEKELYETGLELIRSFAVNPDPNITNAYNKFVGIEKNENEEKKSNII